MSQALMEKPAAPVVTAEPSLQGLRSQQFRW